MRVYYVFHDYFSRFARLVFAQSSYISRSYSHSDSHSRSYSHSHSYSYSYSYSYSTCKVHCKLQLNLNGMSTITAVLFLTADHPDYV